MMIEIVFLLWQKSHRSIVFMLLIIDLAIVFRWYLLFDNRRLSVISLIVTHLMRRSKLWCLVYLWLRILFFPKGICFGEIFAMTMYISMYVCMGEKRDHPLNVNMIFICTCIFSTYLYIDLMNKKERKK